MIGNSELSAREQIMLHQLMTSPVESSIRYKVGTRAAIIGITMAGSAVVAVSIHILYSNLGYNAAAVGAGVGAILGIPLTQIKMFRSACWKIFCCSECNTEEESEQLLIDIVTREIIQQESARSFTTTQLPDYPEVSSITTEIVSMSSNNPLTVPRE